ncbi:MAG: aminodeoxychorismate/anthranilate synthase component II [Patescibacteria group bacterium]
MRTIILDNYDSFTYNLAQYLEELGGNPVVFKNNEKTLAELKAMKPTHLVISPGPGTPENPADIGICDKAIRHFTGKIPILGVCLGHQLIAYLNGAQIVQAPEIMHGKTSKIALTEAGKQSKLFKKIPREFEAMRYHSLVVDEENFPEDLIVTARTSTEEKSIMGLEHRRFALFGVQFHPESFATPEGKGILKNFIQY